MTAKAKQAGVAILGCGYWGVNQARVFHELDQARVVAICDQSADRLHELDGRFGEAILTTDFDQLLTWREVESVIICTGAKTHYALAKRCLEAGKHLLVEKPMTTNVEESRRLIELADARGLLLMVGHTFLFNPAVQAVKEQIAPEKIGDIYYMYSRRTNLGPIRHDVNAIWDLAPHDISIFNYLLDATPKWVSAVGSRVLKNAREDVGFISLGYENGLVGHIHVSWADPSKVRELVVVGSNRRVVFDDMDSLEQVRIFHKGVSPDTKEASSYAEHRLQIHDGDIISPRIDASEPLKNQALHFLECLDRGDRPITDGTSGLQVVQVMDAIERSLATNGAPQALDATGGINGRETVPANGKSLPGFHYSTTVSPQQVMSQEKG